METTNARTRHLPTSGRSGETRQGVPSWAQALAGALVILVGILTFLWLVIGAASAQTLDLQGLEELSDCESGNDYTIDTGNGFYGAVQWTQGTWDWIMMELGYTQYTNVRANQAPPHVQDQAALFLANGPDTYPSPMGFGPEQFGLHHWPVCQYSITQAPVDCSTEAYRDPERCIEMGPSLAMREPAPLQLPAPVFTG